MLINHIVLDPLDFAIFGAGMLAGFIAAITVLSTLRRNR